MEALKEYDSSDESDTPKGSVSKATQQVHSEHKTDVDNTFGLISSRSSQEKNFDTVTKDEKVLKRKLQLGNETLDVEIPNSSFWNDASVLDLQSLQSNEYKNKQTKKYKHSGIKYYSQKDVTPEVDFTNASNSYSSKPSDCEKEDSSKRKTYFVHPKITSHLHKQNVNCKLPTAIEWTNPAHAGVTNRIKWNIPMYSHLLVSCSMDTTVKVWNVWSQLDPCVQVLKSHDKAVKDIDWSHDGKQLLSSSYDKSAAVSDVETGIHLCKKITFNFWTELKDLAMLAM